MNFYHAHPDMNCSNMQALISNDSLFESTGLHK